MTRPRRDPRAERAALRVAPRDAGGRPRYDRTAPRAGGRPRRDPRAEREGRRVAGFARPRFDVSQQDRAEAPVAVQAARPAQAAPAVVTVEDPAFLVVAVPDCAGGRLSTHDRQLLGAARVLAGRDGAVVLLATGDCAGCGAAGADRLVAHGDGDRAYDPAGRAARIAAALTALDPRHVLFPESLDGGDVARRVAVRLGAPVFTQAEGVSASGLIRPARGRSVEQRAAPGLLATVAPDAVAEYAGPPREARPLTVAMAEPAPAGTAILSAQRVPADPATVPLALAEFVTAAGNGVTDLDAFRQLVAALRATPGASRVLCDSGLMPRRTQVGASGIVLAATCYLALGISGAPQHLQGVAGCEHVVAVNTDLHAAMIERAGLAVVQDAQAVMPALLRLLAEEAARPEVSP
ncbi:electron transfer flavoprotein subunit alpha/FixB family protein [Methylobacterium sp. NMS14P]|uniref:electron transfer flavoprotein subunit alpha/FixB family protein n=1 Tax=Methylobacterium sp. NMS14P TaxID=2894310 RepID=UPI00235A35E2|nr:electron transfer flavoprotein subunit alpha/FixB family protein [Methylobacterium sp. NMS14P]WCS27851.1 electron transfer flavoprotein subunit alpha/FixB family protein [Methylobacterium sp. NMS14P]